MKDTRGLCVKIKLLVKWRLSFKLFKVLVVERFVEYVRVMLPAIVFGNRVAEDDVKAVCAKFTTLYEDADEDSLREDTSETKHEVGFGIV